MADNIVHLVLAKVPGDDGRIAAGMAGISLFVVPKWLPSANGELGDRNDITVMGLNHKMGSWILEPSATGLCEPDLHVFAKLFEDRLERGLEAQAFSGREIGGDDDVLDFFVGQLVDVDLARQPAA